MSETFDYLGSTADRLSNYKAEQPQAPALDALVKEEINKTSGVDPNIDSLVGDEIARQDKVSSIDKAVHQGVQQDPDEFAKYVRLSKQTGLDPMMLSDSPDIVKEAKRQESLKNINVEDLYKSNPQTAEFMADPENASVAHDDVENLSAIEQDYKAMLDTLYTWTLKPVAKVGSGALIKGPASAFGVAAAAIGKIAEDMSTDKKPQTKVSDIFGLGDPGEAGRIASSRIVADIGRTLGLGPTFTRVEDYLLGQQRALNRYGDRLSGTTGKEGFIENSIMSGFESFGQMIPALMYGKSSGDLMGLLGIMSAETLGTTYGEDRKKGVSAGTAQIHAFKDFIAEGSTELIPVKYLLQDKVFKQNILKNMVNYAWREGSTEQVATIWQDFNKWAYTEPDKSAWEFLKERPSAALSTAIAVSVAGLGQVGAVMVADQILNRDSTEQTKAYFDALANGVNNSKLQKRLPEKMKEFIAKVKEKGDIKDTFIDASKFSTYFQDQGIDPAIPAKELLGEEGPKLLSDAIAKGGDLVIPLETYAAQVAGTPYHEGLSKDLRLRQGDMSANEYEEYRKQESEHVADVEAMVQESRSNGVENGQIKQIYDDIYNEVLGVGLPKEQASVYATLEAERYRSRAARLGGVDALELWNKEGAVTMTRPGLNPTEPSGTRLNQFAGVKAETVHQDLFKEAQQRLNNGEDWQKVREDTGFFMGEDNKWRFEISDKEAKLTPLAEDNIVNPTQDKGLLLSEVLDHPKLFNAYPFLKNVVVKFGEPGDALGYSSEGVIKIGKDAPNPLNTMLHEIQHSIQRFEGHATGGTPDMMIGEKLTKERAASMEVLKKELSDTMAAKGDISPIRRKMAKIFYENSYVAYRKLLGESEARDTQARQDMSDEERRATLPAESLKDDVIVIFNNQSDREEAINKTVSWSSSRMSKIFRKYGGKEEDKRSGMVAFINPQSFINATTASDKVRSSIEAESRELNPEDLYNEKEPITLWVSYTNGKLLINHHEGRHRMVALRNFGATKVPVLLDVVAREFPETPIVKNLEIGHQFGKGSFVVDQAVEISAENKDYIRAVYGKRPNDIAFSMSDMRNLPYTSDVQFAETINNYTREDNSPYIVQETKTTDDIRKIAKEVLKDVVKNPARYAQQVLPGKLTADQYFTDEQTGEPVDIKDKSQWYRLSDLGRQLAALPTKKLRKALDEEAKQITKDRQISLAQLGRYLTGNQGYTDSEAGRIILVAAKLAYTDDGQGNIEVVKQANNNRHVFDVSGEFASLINQELHSGTKALAKNKELVSMRDALKNAIVKNNAAVAAAQKLLGKDGWVKFAKSDSYEDSAALSGQVAGSGWCTAAQSNAQSQLSRGDFWLYYDKGRPEIAIRTVDSRLDEPPRGRLKGQKLSEKYQKVAEDFLKYGSKSVSKAPEPAPKEVSGGEQFIEDRKSQEALRKYKSGGTLTKEELKHFTFTLSADKKYTSYWIEPESIAGEGEEQKEIKTKLQPVIEDGVFWGSLHTGLDDFDKMLQIPPGIHTIKGDLIGGFMAPELRHVGGDAEFYGKSVAPKLETVGGDFTDSNTRELPSIRSVGGSMWATMLTSAPKLETVGRRFDTQKLKDAPSLVSVGAELFSTSLESAPKLERVGNFLKADNLTYAPRLTSVNKKTVEPIGKEEPSAPEVAGGEDFIEDRKSMDAFRKYKKGSSMSKEDLKYFTFIPYGKKFKSFWLEPESLAGEVEEQQEIDTDLQPIIEDGVFWGSLQAFDSAAGWDMGEIHTVKGNVIGNFNAPELKDVTGYVELWGDSRFPKLETVGRGLQASGNSSAPNVTSVGGDLILQEGASIPKVTDVGGSLRLSVGTSAPNVTRVGEHLVMYMKSKAPKVISVGGNFSIAEGSVVSSLTSVGGNATLNYKSSVPSLTSVGGNLAVYSGSSAPNLTSVGEDVLLGIGSVAPSLTSVGGNLTMQENSSAPSLTSVGGILTMREGASAPNFTGVGNRALNQTNNGYIGTLPRVFVPVGTSDEELNNLIGIKGTPSRTQSLNEPVGPSQDKNVLRAFDQSVNPFPESMVQGVVYHATTKGFEKFRVVKIGRPGKYGSNYLDYDTETYTIETLNELGPNFATNARQAEEVLYTKEEVSGYNIIPVYLNIKHPFNMGSEFDFLSAVNGDTKVIDKTTDWTDDLYSKVLEMHRSDNGPRKFAKFLKNELIKLGYDGIVYNNEYEGIGEPSYIAFDNSQIKSAISGQFMQEPQAKGFVTFGPGMRAITLNPAADFSTIIHEFGHTWIEELQRDATGEQATEQLKKDWETLVEWTGIVDPNGEIPVDAHEQIARGIETYFTEGSAPSIPLKRVFSKVKAWMLSVYKSFRSMDRINKNVRSVFDRMLAVDIEIEQSRAMAGYVKMFSDPNQAGMTESEYKAYTLATVDTIREDQEKLINKVYNELAKRQSKEFINHRKAVSKEAETHALTLKEYAAINTLSKGLLAIGDIDPVKLSKEGVIELVGESGLRAISPQALKIKESIYSETEGVHPDTIARELGFRTGTFMLQQFAAKQPMVDYIKDWADNAMLERYGNPMDPGELRIAAEEEVHSERQAELLEIELNALKRKKSQVDKITNPIKSAAARERATKLKSLETKIPLATVKEIARNEISNTVISQLKPHSYLLAEVRSGNRAMEHFRRDRLDEAIEAKQQQILNFYLYREAVRAKREVDSRERVAKNSTGAAARAKIGLAGQEWLEQYDNILNEYSFATLPTTIRARNIIDWAKSVEADTGEIIALSPEITKEGKKKNYKELTVDEFRAVTDTMKSIRHIASKLTSVTRNGEKQSMKLAMEELTGAAYNNIAYSEMVEEPDLHGIDRLKKGTLDFINTTWRPEKIFERLDNGKQGVWHDLFWNPSVTAQNQHDELRQMAMTPLVGLLEQAPKEFSDSMSDRLEIESMDQVVTRRRAIGMMLNIGNASNRSKLQGGGMWFGDTHMELTDEMVDEVKDKLNEHDWKAIQTMWDSVAKFAPFLDDLNKRAVGLPLKMVEKTPVDTKYGRLEGGYWPAVADPRHSHIGEVQENEDGGSLSTMFPPKFPKAATRHSFREERTGAVYPLQLDWKRIIQSHINKAATDVAYHEWVKQSRRILDNTAVKKSIQNTLGDNVYRGLHDWLVHQVAPVTGGYQSGQSIDNIMNAALTNVVIAALGFKLATAVGNVVVAPIQASHQVKSRYMAMDLLEYLHSPKVTTGRVHALSGEMRHRFEHYDQTFSIAINSLSGNTSFRANVARMSMAVHLYADRITSTFLWMAKFHQEMDNRKTMQDQNKASNESISLADKMIRTTQTAGAPKDLSAFERDPRYRIFKIFIGPMIIMQNEQRGAIASAGGLRGALTDPKAWGVMMATWIIPSMLFEFAVGRGPDDDEDWWQWMLRKIALYQGQQMPFIRDAASTLESVMGNREPMSRSNPISDIGIIAIKESAKAFKDNADSQAITKSVTKAIGPLLGVPSNQITIVEDYLFDTVKKGPQPPQQLIFRKYNH